MGNFWRRRPGCDNLSSTLAGGVETWRPAHASAPTDSPVHPIELLATIYHALGIDPGMLIYNDLNQPRPLVDASPVLGLFA